MAGLHFAFPAGGRSLENTVKGGFCAQRALALILQKESHADETNHNHWERKFMLGWTLMFFIIALVAGVLGFTAIAGAAAGIAKILFVIFIVLFLASLVGQLLRSK